MATSDKVSLTLTRGEAATIAYILKLDARKAITPDYQAMMSGLAQRFLDAAGGRDA